MRPPAEVELDRTPYTTWGGYGGLTLRGRPDWHDTRLLLAGSPAVATRCSATGPKWCALDGPLADADGEHEVGIAMLDHPDNPGHPVPWYASTRQPAYELDGWTNFVNAAFLWDGPMTVAAGDDLRPALPVRRPRRAMGRRAHRQQPRPSGATDDPAGSTAGGPQRPELGRELVDLVVSTLDELVERPPARVPHPRTPSPATGSSPTSPPTSSSRSVTWPTPGSSTVAGSAIDDAIATVLTRIDGPDTHTFFSYRVAETLARYGSFADNRLIAGGRRAARDNVAEACDSSIVDPAARPGPAPQLRRRAVALRGRPARASACSTTRRLVGPHRPRSPAARRPTHGTTSTTRPTAPAATTSTPPTSGCSPNRWPTGSGPVWAEGLATALELVEVVGSPDGTAVGWGRSTGVLAAALTDRAGARSPSPAATRDRPALWLRRAADAAANLDRWFDDGLITAHQHRSTYDYRGPFRRLQLTLDILGKLAWAAKELADRRPRASTRPATPRRTRGRTSWCASRTSEPAAVWAHRSPGVELVIPFVGATRSDYLPAPHHRGPVRGAGRRRPGRAGCRW